VEERKYPFKDTTAQSKSVEVIKEKARKNENNKRATNYIKMLRNQAVSGDVLTWQQIADQLNEGGYRTARSKFFQPMQVNRIFKRVTTG
jgi:hypothetical protein